MRYATAPSRLLYGL